ncbi:unnamed protein product, partial [marine sediment metagenome]
MPKTTKFKLTLELEFDMAGDRTGITDHELIHAIARKKSHGFITQKFSKRDIKMTTSAAKIKHDVRFGNRMAKYGDKIGCHHRPKDTSKPYITVSGYASDWDLQGSELCRSSITYVAAHPTRYTYDLQQKGERDIVRLAVNADKTVTATLTKKALTLLRKVNRNATFAQ